MSPRLPVLITLLLLSSCAPPGDLAPAPAATPAPPVGTVAPPAVVEATPAPAPTPPQLEITAPLVSPLAGPVPGGVADKLTFHGWSRDGARFAFELYDHGPGATACEGAFHLYVVDAARDDFMPGGHLEVGYAEPEPADGVCSPRDLAAAMAPQRAALLERYGIVSGLLGTRSTFQPDGDRWLLQGPDGPLHLRFVVEHADREAVMGGAPGASYALAWDGATQRVIEDGQRHRGGVWTYSLDAGAAFFAPVGRNVAILVQKRQPSFEGDRLSWMANGAVRP